MRGTPDPNPFTPQVPAPVPQNVHDASRPGPDGRGNPGREGRPFPPGGESMDYDDGAWM